MKKLLFLFLGLSLLTSCSSDDNNLIDEGRLGELVVKVDQGDHYVGDKVSIHVTNTKGEEVKDARIFIDNVQVNPLYEFDKAGKLNVIAKKDGYTASIAVEVVVKGLEILQIKASSNDLHLGDNLKFVVIDANNNEVKDVKIYNVKSGVEVKDNVFNAIAEGEFAFVAKKSGYMDSPVFSVKVSKLGNFFGFQNQRFAIDNIFLSIKQTKLANGNLVDKVEVLNGKAMNEVSVMAMQFNEDFSYNYIELTVWVPNPTVKLNNGKVVDYGKRLDFKDVKGSVVVSASTTDVKGVTNIYSIEDNQLKKYELSVFSLNLVNGGIGSGENGIEVPGKFSFKTLEGEDLYINFDGNLFFGESL